MPWNVGQVLFPKRSEVDGLAALLKGISFRHHCHESGFDVGLNVVAGCAWERRRGTAAGGNLAAQFGHDFEQDAACEFFQFVAEARIGQTGQGCARPAGTAATLFLFQDPGGGAPARIAGASDLGCGTELTIEARLADAESELRIVLDGLLHSPGSDAE